MRRPDDPNPIGPARARERFDATRDPQGRPGMYLEIELRGPVVDEAGRVVVPDAVMKGIRVEGDLPQTELDRAIGYAGGCAYCRGLGVHDFGSHETDDCPVAWRRRLRVVEQLAGGVVTLLVVVALVWLAWH